MSRVLLAVSAVLALALGACGGDDLGSKSAREVLQETFGPDKPVDSGKIDLRIAFEGQGLRDLQGPLRLELKGPFASAGKRKLPRFDLDAALDVGGQSVAAGAVSTGEAGWLKLAGSTFAVDEGSFAEFRKRYEADQQRSESARGSTFKALGVDPARWLADPKKAGEERVSGTETVHVTSKVDVPAFLDDVNKLLGRADAAGAAAAAGAEERVPTKLTDEQRRQIEESVESTSLDVYAGKEDGTLRRLNIQVRFDVPEADRVDAGGLSTGSLGFDLVLSDLDEEQEIAAPKDARPLSDLTRGTGGTGATGAAGATPPGDAQGSYRACLDAAGDDLAEVQECAPLLNGG